MCYETSLHKTQKQIQKTFSVEFKNPDLFTPYYHRSGFTHPNLYVIPQEEAHLVYAMQWGLVAPFGEADVKAFRKKYNTLNAKSESVLRSRMYQSAARERRCLVLADGFFEPHHQAGGVQPYYCYLPQQALFCFAGIYTQMASGAYTVSILTMAANPFFAEIHNTKKRMPLVLDPSKQGAWLDPNLSDADIQELINNGFIQQDFKAHAVSSDLYKRQIDTNTPRILEPIATQD